MNKAAQITKRLLDVDHATRELIDAALPVLALRMCEAARGQLAAMGVWYKQRLRTKSFTGTKTTRATDWLDEQDMDELTDGMADLLPAGSAVSIMTELPRPMRERIARELKTSFDQDYWRGISETTQGDAERILKQGVDEGWSVQEMAAQLKESLGGDDYARTRAYNIARTESGNALNGARKGVMDQLQEDLGDRVPMRATWLSVLSNTTRDSHAQLDGVPADEDGLWDLDGVMVPWPGYYELPPGNRCNCRCSLLMELGMQDEEAGKLISDYYDRLEAAQADNETAVRGLQTKGGSGSGNFGHAGRPGEVGGSSSVFHGTAGEFVVSIKKDGLKPGPAVNGRGVYAIADKHTALRYGFTKWTESHEVLYYKFRDGKAELGDKHRIGVIEIKRSAFPNPHGDAVVRSNNKIAPKDIVAVHWYRVADLFTKTGEWNIDNAKPFRVSKGAEPVVYAVVVFDDQDLGELVSDLSDVAPKSIKGDLPGHEFRGNQWTGGGAAKTDDPDDD